MQLGDRDACEVVGHHVEQGEPQSPCNAVEQRKRIGNTALTKKLFLRPRKKHDWFGVADVSNND